MKHIVRRSHMRRHDMTILCRIVVPLCSGSWGFPAQMAISTEFWSLLRMWWNVWTNGRMAGERRRFNARCDVNNEGLPHAEVCHNCDTQRSPAWIWLIFSKILKTDIPHKTPWTSLLYDNFLQIQKPWAWWRHQMETFSALLAICAGNSPVAGEFPHKGQWRGALMSSLICTWINGWVNNGDAGDLRRHRAHYDVPVMRARLHTIRVTIIGSRQYLSYGVFV